MISYFIYLENDCGQKGYLTLCFENSFQVSDDVSEAARFESEDTAEHELDQLELRYGLNREEAKVQLLVTDEVYHLRLKNGEYGDAIIVQREGESEQRWLTVRNGRFEASEHLPDEVADMLVALLMKIDERLHGRTENKKTR